MTWFILFVGVVVVCFIAALVLGLIGGGSVGGLGGETRSLSHEPLPDEPIVDSDFDDLVFDVGLRGYRMSQVDGVVDRLRRELREKDEEIAVLRGEAGTATTPDRKSSPSAPSDGPDGAEPRP
ncbi:cell division protein DivIVA [Humibacillus xanthopallidus]|uniref:DivIVA domain-containing protein n=1 Tax=Humibacillus xanthopallidus TaxID=412689 RepID=A0A543HV38_9MICO|nr:cell division protein DivIVA [Humibacillus xanthopallidus]TQM62196.1 hypothetical protein FBY41_2225 [Humibacillus xanthopallidus]